MPFPHKQSQLLPTLLITGLLLCNTGCSLFVMAGKALFGDPKVTSPFTAATGQKLTESEEKIVIICDAPHGVTAGFPSVQIDILDRVSRNLESQGIRVVPPGDVASWFDDHGEWGDYSELANEFDAGYVLHVNLREIDHRVPESANLMRGNAEGHLTVYRIHKPKKTGLLTGMADDERRGKASTASVFDRDFKVEFPTSYPVPRETRSEEQFVQSFLDRVGLHLSQHLYDYNMSESIH